MSVLSKSANRVCILVSQSASATLARYQSSLAPLDSSRLEIRPAGPLELNPKPDIKNLAFGRTFTDHWLRVKWNVEQGWGTPVIEPLKEMKIHPAAKVFHYAQTLFEGLKAYRGVDNKIRLFRPMHNMARMNMTAQRACLPTFDGQELMKMIRDLVVLDQEWVPHCTSSSLYIRPTMMGVEPMIGLSSSNEVDLFVILGPVGPYFSTGVKPVNLLADPNFIRAWPGGSGYAKMGSNYAPTLWIGEHAKSKNCHQVLWLFGDDHEITEVGAMNIFIFLDKPGGGQELVTPSLATGTTLPGVTRRSILELTQDWGEFEVCERKITMNEIVEAKAEGRLREIFGAGTAVVVSPVGGILYQDKMIDIPVPQNGLASRILKTISDIHYGRILHPWAVDIEEWKLNTQDEFLDFKTLKHSSQS